MSAHGDRNTYSHGCRCPDCTAANTAYIRTLKTGVVPPGGSHGLSGYKNYRCRCPVCYAAQSKANAAAAGRPPPEAPQLAALRYLREAALARHRAALGRMCSGVAELRAIERDLETMAAGGGTCSQWAARQKPEVAALRLQVAAFLRGQHRKQGGDRAGPAGALRKHIDQP